MDIGQHGTASLAGRSGASLRIHPFCHIFSRRVARFPWEMNVCSEGSVYSEPSMINSAVMKSLREDFNYYYKHFFFLHFALIFGTPLVLWHGFRNVELQPKTVVLSLVLFPIYGIAIAAGYHRLWSHRSYRACLALRYFLASAGAGQFQWSILWWARHHRAHHRYLDSEKDPYNARRGLLYSHIGWLIGYNPDAWGKADVSDLEKDPVVVWQQRYYVLIAVIAGLLVPATIAHVGWDDWWGGFFYAGGFRLYIYLHFTFLLNSLAHYAGDQPYSTEHTPRDNLLLALVTSGEGYHNFHHTFPADYRSGVHWYAFDPSKWFIWSCTELGLASSPFRTPERDIKFAVEKNHIGKTKANHQVL